MNELGEEPRSGKYLYLTSPPASSVNYCGEEDYAKISKIFASTKFDIATGIQQHYEYSMDRCLCRVRSSSSRRRTYMIFYLRVFAAIFILLLIIQISPSIGPSRISTTALRASLPPSLPQIIVITPTYRRSTRLADMTRMANTLSHIKCLHWVVIEDGNQKVKAVERLLNRTGLPHTYFPAKTSPGYPRRGWYQRTMALQYLRNHTDLITGDHKKSIVYFGDDDNSYDLRLFNDYIRKVQKVGIWAVGLAGGTLVESPAVVNRTVIGWNVLWNKKRKFATDMAGFAVALDVILNSTAVFGKSCKRGLGAPETCFLEDLGLRMSDLEPFGFEQKDREILVWHTKTVKVTFNKRIADTNGFFVE